MKKRRINWWGLRGNTNIFLKNGILKDIIYRGTIKADSLRNLCKLMKATRFYYTSNTSGISISKLKSLLHYIGEDYCFINNKIKEIRQGSKISIKNPKFPINLFSIKLANLLGHIVSDGSLSYDKSRKNFIRTLFWSEDKEIINEFIKDVNGVFGKSHFYSFKVRGAKGIRYGSNIIGKTLQLAGAPVGRKCKLNTGIPWVIKYGSKKMKRFYLSAIFDDEGSIWAGRFPYLILSRNVHTQFDNEEELLLEDMIFPLMKIKRFPSGHETMNISLSKLKSQLKKEGFSYLLKQIYSAKPKLLLDEAKLMKDCFGLIPKLYVNGFSVTTNGHFSVSTTLMLQRKTCLVKFYKHIGFNLKRKQNKLKNALHKNGWLKDGI